MDTITGIVIAQVTVDTRSNEITSFASLLDAVEAALGTLDGVLFTADALHAQTVRADKGHRPPSAPARTGERQPAHPVQAAETASLAPDPGR
ncbi:hypothetical protein AB0M54_44625 [Actinoplanes sp. NPDC051470]|uniref:hypothetical protein n=1 Tax=unclassified Actinoplanes TaxID=2626549 RepID=UPI003416FAF1